MEKSLNISLNNDYLNNISDYRFVINAMHFASLLLKDKKLFRARKFIQIEILLL